MAEEQRRESSPPPSPAGGQTGIRISKKLLGKLVKSGAPGQFGVIIIGLSAFLILVTMGILLGGGGIPGTTAIEEAPQGGEELVPPNEGPDGNILPPEPPGPVDQNEIGKYVIVRGGDAAQRERIYRILSIPIAYTMYKDLFTRGGPVYIEFTTKPCGGRVETSNTILLHSFASCSDRVAKYVLIHEAGHIIASRNGRTYQSFNHSALQKSDPGCYDNDGYLVTYPRAPGKGPYPKAESFAEAIALYLLYPERPPLNNFPSQCKETYNWAIDNVFKQ